MKKLLIISLLALSGCATPLIQRQVDIDNAIAKKIAGADGIDALNRLRGELAKAWGYSDVRDFSKQAHYEDDTGQRLTNGINKVEWLYRKTSLVPKTTPASAPSDVVQEADINKAADNFPQ